MFVIFYFYNYPSMENKCQITKKKKFTVVKKCLLKWTKKKLKLSDKKI